MTDVTPTRVEAAPLFVTHLVPGDGCNILHLSQEVCAAIGLNENGEVSLTVENGKLIITPVKPQSVDQEKVGQLLDQLVDRRRDVYQRLAQ